MSSENEECPVVWTSDPLVLVPTVGEALRRIGRALRNVVGDNLRETGQYVGDFEDAVDEELRRVLARAADELAAETVALGATRAPAAPPKSDSEAV